MLNVLNTCNIFYIVHLFKVINDNDNILYNLVNVTQFGLVSLGQTRMHSTPSIPKR